MSTLTIMQILSLYQFKRDESSMNDSGNPNNVALDNLASFKCKASFLGKATDADGNDRSLKKYKNSCSIEVFICFFQIIRNAFN